jgi:hypothetical protein
MIYRHTALVQATYSINVVFLAITKTALQPWLLGNLA